MRVMSQAALWGIITIIIIIVAAGAFWGGMIYGQSTAKPSGGAKKWTPPSTIKAAWIYVGPIGDFGWTYMHELGREFVAKLYKDWLQTTYVESVSEDQLPSTIDNLVSKGYNVIFTTSFEFMDKTLEKAKEYPNVIFFHCSGYKRWDNMGTYFADLYQVYYLNGLIAGALTKTGHIGYVAAFTTPEVVRHINAFAIGAKEVASQRGINIKVHVLEIGAWFAPDKARSAGQTLWHDYDVDVLAYTEDSTALLQLAEEKTSGYLNGTYDHPLYVFSHYSPGWIYGKHAVVSGQIVHWEVLYEDILAKIKAGIYTPYNLKNVDYWDLLDSGAVDWGAWIFDNGTVMHINPEIVPILKNITVTDKVTGKKMSVYDLVYERYYQMKNTPRLVPLELPANLHNLMTVSKITVEKRTAPYTVASVFDPFIGPLHGYTIKDHKPVSVPNGKRLGHDDLWSMQWFVDWVQYLGSGG
jgi:basic membrane protein A